MVRHAKTDGKAAVIANEAGSGERIDGDRVLGNGQSPDAEIYQ
jgi:hypothetical protein